MYVTQFSVCVCFSKLKQEFLTWFSLILDPSPYQKFLHMLKATADTRMSLKSKQLKLTKQPQLFCE